jgi:hypothetical protein
MAGTLLITGTGRNVGKTTLAVAVVRRVVARKEGPVAALKISPHSHPQTYPMELLEEGSREGEVRYRLWRELGHGGEKDSARFFAAGARPSLYLEAEREQWGEAWQAVCRHLDPAVPLVCESGRPMEMVQPDLLLAVLGASVGKENPFVEQADRCLCLDPQGFDAALADLRIVSGRWKL